MRLTKQELEIMATGLGAPSADQVEAMAQELLNYRSKVISFNVRQMIDRGVEETMQASGHGRRYAEVIEKKMKDELAQKLVNHVSLDWDDGSFGGSMCIRAQIAAYLPEYPQVSLPLSEIVEAKKMAQQMGRAG